jgi:pimeloyl-ACP methyl ester carboxylesterase
MIDHTVELPDGRTLAWTESADPAGVPLLLLHGTPGGRLGPAAQVARYTTMGLRVIAPERPGYGRSTARPGRRVVDDAADQVVLLDHLGLDRVIVLGGSGGGPHALALAAMAPERVAAVGVLVGAAPLAPEEADGMLGINRTVFDAVTDPERLRQVVDAVRVSLLEKGLSATAADAHPGDVERWRENAAHFERMLTDALAPGADGMVDDYRAVFGDDWGFAPEDVAAPVLWAHGDADRNVPISAVRRYAARLPEHRLIEWPGVGHAPEPLPLAEMFAGLLAAAYRRVESARSPLTTRP